MDAAVFLRGINTGNRRLKPAEFARTFARARLENIGAAGTFVARETPSARVLRTAIREKLPFSTEVFVLPAAEVLALIRASPFGSGPPPRGVRWAVSVVMPAIERTDQIPPALPNATNWEVRIIRVQRSVVLSTYRRIYENRMLYPNEAVERAFGVQATTRWWETFVEVGRVLASSPSVNGGRE